MTDPRYEYRKEWKRKHPDRVKEYNRNYKKKYPERSRADNKRNVKRLKDQIFDILGRKCANPECPIPRDKLDPRCLQIDHINNDGATDRKLYTPGYSYYGKVLRDLEEGNQRYQILCVYCNWLKRYIK